MFANVADLNVIFANGRAMKSADAFLCEKNNVKGLCASDAESGPYNGGFRVQPSTRKSPWLHSEKSKVGLGGVHSCTSKSA